MSSSNNKPDLKDLMKNIRNIGATDIARFAVHSDNRSLLKHEMDLISLIEAYGESRESDGVKAYKKRKALDNVKGLRKIGAQVKLINEGSKND